MRELGLEFWLERLNERIRLPDDPDVRMRWGALQAHLATELVILQEIAPTKVEEIFEYASHLVPYWARKFMRIPISGLELEELSSWGERISEGLPAELDQLVNRLGQSIRDRFTSSAQAGRIEPMPRNYRSATKKGRRA